MYIIPRSLFSLLLVYKTLSYDPNWDSLDKRPTPTWYDEARVGIFLHWGVYAVPGNGEWFWNSWRTGARWAVDYMKANYPPNFTYGDFASMFHAELFNATEWANIFKAAGARYVVLTSKHHEGFTNWPSAVSFNWNAKDVGPARDIVGELSAAVKASGIHFGLYHSLLEWFHPLYMADKANGWRTQDFAKTKSMPELYELVRLYQPEIIWGDGAWEAPADYWNSTYFLAWLFNESPIKDHVVINDQWGSDTNCKHGDFWDCSDGFHPGKLFPHKWESDQTINPVSWGYFRSSPLASFHTSMWIVATLVHISAYGGNMLLNVGPREDGRIDPISEERLRDMGVWLALNGEAIYGARPWLRAQNDSLNPLVRYALPKASVAQTHMSALKNMVHTTTEPAVYAIVFAQPGRVLSVKQEEQAGLQFPKGPLLAQSLNSPRLVWEPDVALSDWAGPSISLGSVNASEVTRVTLLGYSNDIQFRPQTPAGIVLTVPNFTFGQALQPYQWAYVFKLEGAFSWL